MIFRILFFYYSLRQLFTPIILIYVYQILKSEFCNCYPNLNVHRPISYRWLYKASFLIRKGKFNYGVCATCF